jgi:protoheme ferro-lyase
MKKWMTKDLRERYNQLKQKESELRKEYDRLQGKGIQVKTLEEFYNDKKYRDQMRKQIKGKIRIPEILANGVVVFEQVVYDYELYLRRAEERHGNRG